MQGFREFIGLDEVVKPDAINPQTPEELEEFIFFAILTQGKGAWETSDRLTWLQSYGYGRTPFQKIRHMDRHGLLEFKLWQWKFGKWTQYSQALRAVANLGLKRLNRLSVLTSIPFLGPKTARFILVLGYHIGEDKYAILDRQILAELRDLGYPNAPKETPNNETAYRAWEQIFVDEAHKRNMTVKEFDQQIWLKRRREPGKAKFPGYSSFEEIPTKQTMKLAPAPVPPELSQADILSYAPAANPKDYQSVIDKALQYRQRAQKMADRGKWGYVESRLLN